MTKGIKGLVQSKKFLTLVAVVVGLVATLYGVDDATSKELVLPIAGLVTTVVSVYLIAQGIADLGKGKAQAEREPVEMPSFPTGLSALMAQAAKFGPRPPVQGPPEEVPQ
jgi:hypothetical protein